MTSGLTAGSFVYARLTAVVLACAILAGWAPSVAQAQDDGRREAALVLRILSYDRSLPQRAGDQVTVLVLFRPGHRASEAESRRITLALNELGQRMLVARRRPRATAMPFSTRAALVQSAGTTGAVALYVCDGLDGSLADLVGATREARVLSFSTREQLVRGGLGVGMVPRGSTVELLVNLRAVEAEGARLDAAVLRLAQVIR